MKVSKRRYTYGKSYDGCYYFRWDSISNKGVFVGLFDEDGSLAHAVTIETQYRTRGNMIDERTAEQVTKKEFMQALDKAKKSINKIK